MKVISLFSGCGGSSLGYQTAGFKVALAVEWDKNAVETYRLNFPDTPIWHGDIRKLSTDEILKTTGLKPGELDILDGSPPCQGFSTAGKRIMEDSRNQLFREYVRILQALKPKVFVMENVSGMVKGKMKLVFVEILKALKESGYNVRARVLNAMYFNVPQSRQRMIFIGTRNGLDIEPSHPKGQTEPQSLRDAIGKDGFIIYRRSYSKGKCNFKKHPFGKPCITLLKSSGSLGVYIEGVKRPFNISEFKAISTFPQGFRFSKNDCVWDRVGNTVPPNFMKAIAKHIRDEILD